MATLRETKEWFDYTKMGEKLTSTNILAFMGKAIPCCILSGDTLDVFAAPVDLNQQNMLPSNMAYIAKKVISTTRDISPVAVSFETKKSEDLTISVTLFAPKFYFPKIVEQAKTVVESLEMPTVDHGYDLVYGVWDFLMWNHVKGLQEVSLIKNGETVTIDSAMVLPHFIAKKEMKEQHLAVNRQQPSLKLV